MGPIYSVENYVQPLLYGVMPVLLLMSDRNFIALGSPNSLILELIGQDDRR